VDAALRDKLGHGLELLPGLDRTGTRDQHGCVVAADRHVADVDDRVFTVRLPRGQVLDLVGFLLELHTRLKDALKQTFDDLVGKGAGVGL
jgi:hypothetical protein